MKLKDIVKGLKYLYKKAEVAIISSIIVVGGIFIIQALLDIFQPEIFSTTMKFIVGVTIIVIGGWLSSRLYKKNNRKRK